jgi:hypothetical protein
MFDWSALLPFADLKGWGGLPAKKKIPGGLLRIVEDDRK